MAFTEDYFKQGTPQPEAQPQQAGQAPQAAFTEDYFTQGKPKKQAAEVSAEEATTGAPTTTQTTTTAPPKSSGKFGKLFAMPTERVISVIGNSYAERYLSSGGINCGFVVLSDKRVYMAREVIGQKQKILAKATERHIVDIEDITRTGYYHVSAVGYIGIGIMAIIAGLFIGFLMSNTMDSTAPIIGGGLLGLVIGIICFALYAKNRKSLYMISFAGGEFGLSMDWVKQNEIDKFERDLRSIKDKLKERKNQ